MVGEQRESVEVGGAVEAFTTSHCSRPAQPTPLSALLDRPGLQLLYCLNPGWEVEVGEGGFMGPFTRAPPTLHHHTLARTTQPESLPTIEIISSYTFDLSLKSMH